MTTRRNASPTVHGEVKPGHINAAPKAPLHCGGEAPAPGAEFFTTGLSANAPVPLVRWWPARPAAYQEVWLAMQSFTAARTAETPDEIWLVEHAPVYTLGQAGDPSHVLNPGSIPLIQSDRGGQVTYHGPGQLVAYCLFDLRRLGLFVKSYVALLEEAVIRTLADFGLHDACRRPGAPGVYLPQTDGTPAKIAALGVKIRQGCSYHGVALNVDMDLTPFGGINPCGYEGLRTVDMRAAGVEVALEDVGEQLVGRILALRPPVYS